MQFIGGVTHHRIRQVVEDAEHQRGIEAGVAHCERRAIHNGKTTGSGMLSIVYILPRRVHAQVEVGRETVGELTGAAP